MRRAFQTLLLALSSLVLFALPAFAEEAEKIKSEAFGAGQWDGLILSLIFGAIVGTALFIDAYAGAKGEVSSHH